MSGSCVVQMLCGWSCVACGVNFVHSSVFLCGELLRFRFD